MKEVQVRGKLLIENKDMFDLSQKVKNYLLHVTKCVFASHF